MTLTTHITEDLKRLTRLAANISDAHTSAIFLPTSIAFPTNQQGSSDINPLATDRNIDRLTETSITSTFRGTRVNSSSKTIELKRVVSEAQPTSESRSIDLVALQSLSNRTHSDVRLQVGVGLLGWVAEQGRPIHIAPFDLESTTLGLYTENEPIKCLAAVPIPIQPQTTLGIDRETPPQFGVLMCDSKKAFSFTKMQIKHLEELAPIVGRLVFWACKPQLAQEGDPTWTSFLNRSQRLADAIGTHSVEILRIKMSNLSEIEEKTGLTSAILRAEQFLRLLQQALPPHFPVTKLAEAEVLVTVDNMMSNFFQNKIKALAVHLSEESLPFIVHISSHSMPHHQGSNFHTTTAHTTTLGSASRNSPLQDRSSKEKRFDIDAVLRQPKLTVHTNQSVVSGGNRA